MSVETERLYYVIVHIVEDDEAVADALSTVLGVLGYQPAVYSTGETFLSDAFVASDDLVILDLGLPGMSGIDVAQHLRSLPVLPRIILVSGKPQARLDRHMRGLADLPLLRKPLSIDTLAEAVA